MPELMQSLDSLPTCGAASALASLFFTFLLAAFALRASLTSSGILACIQLLVWNTVRLNAVLADMHVDRIRL